MPRCGLSLLPCVFPTIVDCTLLNYEWLLLSRLEALKVREAVFYLDQQVSNSGRLRGLLLELGVEYSTEIRAELHPCVDGLLSPMEGVVTSDAIILDKCGSWYNLNRDIVTRSIPNAWLFRPSFPNQ